MSNIAWMSLHQRQQHCSSRLLCSCWHRTISDNCTRTLDLWLWQCRHQNLSWFVAERGQVWLQSSEIDGKTRRTKIRYWMYRPTVSVIIRFHILVLTSYFYARWQNYSLMPNNTPLFRFTAYPTTLCVGTPFRRGPYITACPHNATDVKWFGLEWVALRLSGVSRKWTCTEV